MNKAILFLVLGVILLLAGCTSESNVKNADYKMPADYATQTFEVTTPDMDALNKMQSYEISEYEKTNLSQISKDWQAKREEQEKYDMVRKIADDTSIENEEENLAQYCDSLISNSCLQMKYTKDHNGCREVEVECKRYNCDKVCIKYDISISSEFLDEKDCVE